MAGSSSPYKGPRQFDFALAQNLTRYCVKEALYTENLNWPRFVESLHEMEASHWKLHDWHASFDDIFEDLFLVSVLIRQNREIPCVRIGRRLIPVLPFGEESPVADRWYSALKAQNFHSRQSMEMGAEHGGFRELFALSPKSVGKIHVLDQMNAIKYLSAATEDNSLTQDILAFRFVRTEKFITPIPKETLETLNIPQPQNPRKITDQQFASVYRLGMNLLSQ